MSGTEEFESFEVARCQSWIHTNARTQRFPAEHCIVGGLSCCQSQWFIVVTHLCLSVFRSQLVFTAAKWPKKVRCFAFDMSHVSTKLCPRTAFIRGQVILLCLVVVEEVMCKFSVPVRGPAGAYVQILR